MGNQFKSKFEECTQDEDFLVNTFEWGSECEVSYDNQPTRGLVEFDGDQLGRKILGCGLAVVAWSAGRRHLERAAVAGTLALQRT
jgi:hypothetical protein